MSWISNLCELYDYCQPIVGVFAQDNKTPLLPIGQSTQNAQVEVTLDMDGNLIRAIKLEKPESTIIPCTEDSASRSGAAEYPHPLFDKLQYTAGDYRKFGGTKGKNSFNIYISNLEQWCNSEFSHPKVISVFRYLRKGTLVQDLIQQMVVDFDGLTNKIIDATQLEFFVRFRVQHRGDENDALWLDQSVWKSYIDYYSSMQDEIDLCYVSGEKVHVTEKHAKKLRNTGDGAKIISSNDTTGFTYLGKFSTRNQVVTIGFETSHKAFNALRWIIEQHGYRNDSQVIVAFSNRNQNIPYTWQEDELLFELDEEIPFVDINHAYSENLRKSLSGYKQDLRHSNHVTVMGLDAATPGRLSIFYYRELFPDEYLEKVQQWYESIVWIHRYKFNAEKKPYEFVGTPSPTDIALAAYGKRADPGIVKKTVERLLPCIFDGRVIPIDLVLMASRRASNPQAVEKYEWNKTLSIACALNKKFFEREDIKMALDENITDRSYLFGRLLAIADKVESMTFEKGEDRQTNAMRYMSMYSQNPFRTWEILWKKLIPYFGKLGGKGYRYQNLISGVMEKFQIDEFSKKEALNGKYLLGFHCQRQEFINDLKAYQLRKEEEALENTLINEG